jgi:hypothetical protein
VALQTWALVGDYQRATNMQRPEMRRQKLRRLETEDATPEAPQGRSYILHHCIPITRRRLPEQPR